MKFKGTPKKLKSQISNLKSKTQSLKITLKHKEKEDKGIPKNPQMKAEKKAIIVPHPPGRSPSSHLPGELAKQSPRISRIITEKARRFYAIRWAVSATIICAAAVLVVSMLLFIQARELQTLKTQRSALEANLRAWQAVLQKYPDYRDGYLQAAVVEYRLNNITAARQYVSTALFLDPTFESTKRFLAILNGR